MTSRLIVLLLLFASLPSAGQDLSAATSAGADVSVEELAAMIESVETREDLDEPTKNSVLELLRDAQTQVRSKIEADAAAQKFAEALATAPAELEELRAELDVPPPPTPTAESLGISEDVSLEELQQWLTKETADLAFNDSRLEALKDEVEYEIGRPIAARERIGQLQAERRASTTVAETPGEPEVLSNARRLDAVLQRAAQDAMINMLEQELLSHPVRLSLLQAKRDLRTREHLALSDRVGILRAVVSERRQAAAALAQQAATEAQVAAEGKHPVVRDLAEGNARLTAELPGLVLDIEAANEQLDQIRDAADTIEERLVRSRQLFETGGLTATTGRLLVAENRTLPQTSRHRAQLRERRDIQGETGLAQISIQEQRRQLIAGEQEVRAIVAELGEDIEDQEEIDTIAAEARQLLRERRDLLLQIEDSYNTYLQVLSDLDTEQRRIIETTDEYRAFLAGTLMWIPSAPLLFVGGASDILPALQQTFSPVRWQQTAANFFESVSDRPVTAVFFLLVLAALLAVRRPLAKRYTEINEEVRRVSGDHISLTFGALGIIILRVLPLPLVLVMVSWLLRNAAEPSAFSDAVSRCLAVTAPFLFNALVFRALSLPGGVLGLHFGWPKESLAIIRRQLNRLVTIGAPLLFATGLFLLSDISNEQATVSRFVFIGFMLFLASVVRPIMDPNTGIAAPYYARQPNKWVSKLRWLWFGLAVGLPIFLGLVSALGYVYTSTVLAVSLLQTSWRLLILGVLYLVALRWFALARHKLALQIEREEMQARIEAARSEAQGDAEGEAPVVTQTPLNIDKVDLQTKTLLRSVMIIIAVFVVWSIWVQVLPAFGILDQFGLWNQTVSVDGVDTVVPVTLGDIVFALLIGVVTAIVSKNLPGLMEIAVLQRMTLQPGSGYAIKTVVRYVVVTIGAVWVLNVIGWNWSQIQWLVAALSVGLGFGLQEIVANFVSGLVILFERPVRVGDTVTVGNLTGTVSQVRIRATTITDWDRKEIIVPNKAFITEQVINWTLSDAVNRMVIDVGVSYGSDVELARKVMTDVLTSLPTILDEPPPKVYFMGFGDSSLDFKLYAYLPQISDRLPLYDEIHQAILEALRANDIEIPFPQRDIHIRSTVETE